MADAIGLCIWAYIGLFPKNTRSPRRTLRTHCLYTPVRGKPADTAGRRRTKLCLPFRSKYGMGSLFHTGHHTYFITPWLPGFPGVDAIWIFPVFSRKSSRQYRYQFIINIYYGAVILPKREIPYQYRLTQRFYGPFHTKKDEKSRFEQPGYNKKTKSGNKHNKTIIFVIDQKKRYAVIRTYLYGCF
jgi:hypothetical protein